MIILLKLCCKVRLMLNFQLPVLSSTPETSHRAHLMPSVFLSFSLSFHLSLGALCLTPLSPTLPRPPPPPNRHAPLHFTSSTLHFTKRRKKNEGKLTEKTGLERMAVCRREREKEGKVFVGNRALKELDDWRLDGEQRRREGWEDRRGRVYAFTVSLLIINVSQAWTGIYLSLLLPPTSPRSLFLFLGRYAWPSLPGAQQREWKHLSWSMRERRTCSSPQLTSQNGRPLTPIYPEAGNQNQTGSS